MKRSMFSIGVSNPAFSLAAGLSLAFAGLTHAQVVLSDGNSTATINTSSQAGMTGWTVDGQNQLAQQWFWYRLGATSVASSIDTLTSHTDSMPDSRHLTSIYSGSSFSLELDYVLSGGNSGPGTAGLTESITISNRTASPLDLHFFQYSNFRLAGGTGTDTVQLGKDSHGFYNFALQQHSSGVQVQEADLVPSSSHGEANLVTGGVTDTLYKLNHTSGLSLNDAAGPLTGNATWAFEWDYSGIGDIPVGGTELISKVMSLTVPEPSAATLLGVGWLAFVLRLRRLRK